MFNILFSYASHNARGIDAAVDVVKQNLVASAKKEVGEFFDNVIVNDEDTNLKKNRLELLKMLCKSFDNYFNFSKIEA